MKLKMHEMLAAATLSIGALTGAWAQQSAPAAQVAAMTAGEVRKVDTEQGKITLRHEAIASMDMPPMTMVFRAEKPELLKGLKAGDKVRFHAESKAGAMVVTHIQSDK